MASTHSNLEDSDARSRLRHLICEAIAQGTPFAYEEVLNAYQELGSFDLVLTACEYAASAGIRLSNVIDVLRIDKGQANK